MSGALVAGKRDELQHQGITTVVNAAADVVPSSFAAEPWSAYLSMYLYDSPKQEISHFFPLFVKIVHETERLGGKALVHCSQVRRHTLFALRLRVGTDTSLAQGVSRSGALGIAYVMWADDCTFDKAYHKARSHRPTISPNPGFICQLLEWEQLRRLIRDTPSATLLYQVTTLRRPSVCTGPIAAWMQGDAACTRCEVKYAVTLARTPESRELVRPSRTSLGNTDCGIVRCASTAYICVGIDCAGAWAVMLGRGEWLVVTDAVAPTHPPQMSKPRFSNAARRLSAGRWCGAASSWFTSARWAASQWSSWRR